MTDSASTRITDQLLRRVLASDESEALAICAEEFRWLAIVAHDTSPSQLADLCTQRASVLSAAAELLAVPRRPLGLPTALVGFAAWTFTAISGVYVWLAAQLVRSHDLPAAAWAAAVGAAAFVASRYLHHTRKQPSK